MWRRGGGEQSRMCAQDKDCMKVCRPRHWRRGLMYQCKGLCSAVVLGVVCAVQSEYCFVLGGAWEDCLIVVVSLGMLWTGSVPLKNKQTTCLWFSDFCQQLYKLQ